MNQKSILQLIASLVLIALSVFVASCVGTEGDNSGGSEPDYIWEFSENNDIRFTFVDDTINNIVGVNVDGYEVNLQLTNVNNAEGEFYAFLPTTTYEATPDASAQTVLEEGLQHIRSSSTVTSFRTSGYTSSDVYYTCSAINAEAGLAAGALSVTCTVSGKTTVQEDSTHAVLHQASARESISSKKIPFKLVKFKTQAAYQAAYNAFLNEWNADNFSAGGGADNFLDAVAFLNDIEQFYEDRDGKVSTVDLNAIVSLGFTRNGDEISLNLGPLHIDSISETGLNEKWATAIVKPAEITFDVGGGIESFSSDVGFGVVDNSIGIDMEKIEEEVAPNIAAAHGGGELPEVTGAVYAITNDYSLAFLEEKDFDEKYKVAPTAETATEDGFAIRVDNDDGDLQAQLTMPHWTRIYIVVYNVKAVGTKAKEDTFTVDVEELKSSITEALTGIAGLKNRAIPDTLRWDFPEDYSKGVSFGKLIPTVIVK